MVGLDEESARKVCGTHLHRPSACSATNVKHGLTLVSIPKSRWTRGNERGGSYLWIFQAWDVVKLAVEDDPAHLVANEWLGNAVV